MRLHAETDCGHPTLLLLHEPGHEPRVAAVSVQEILAECGEDAAKRILDDLERQSWADDGNPTEGVLVRYCTEQPELIREQRAAPPPRGAFPP
jgi:hypothetical protein